MYKIKSLFALPLVISVASIVMLSSCGTKVEKNQAIHSEADSLRQVIKSINSANEMIAHHLKIFDTLDYIVFSNQEWTRLHESHSKDIKVNWPDGHYTIGIEKHISDLRSMFVYAPNTSIQEHPVRFGSGNMTCVTGKMTGTFSEPMPVGNGKFISPTGKSFSIPMCTVGIWENHVMVEEYLFWDNQAYMNQIGLGK